MKKYVFLTSMLALAACGGGSGGGGAGGTAPNTPQPLVRVPDTLGGRVTATDNDVITAMKSEVIVASNSSTDLARTPHTVEIDGVTFKSYRLEDINLYTADSVNTDNGYLQIGMDENTGRIDNIKMVIGGVGAPVERRDNDSYFYGPIFEYVADGDDQALFRMPDTGQTAAQLAAKKAELVAAGKPSNGHWNLINEHMDVVTYGRNIGNNKVLQYSDFGHFNPVYRTKYKNAETLNDAQLSQARNGQDLGRGDSLDKIRGSEDFNTKMAKEDYQLFAGGYAIEGTTLKDSLAVPNNTTFKGMAIGRVYTTVSADDGVSGATREARATAHGYSSEHDIAKSFTTKEATLVIDANGKQTLNMPFNTHSDTADKFYDVKLVQDANGNIVGTPEFTGTPTNADHRITEGTMNGMIEAQSDITMRYYGVNIASEAAGTARFYSEEDLGSGVTREYEVQAAYGMKRQ